MQGHDIEAGEPGQLGMNPDADARRRALEELQEELARLRSELEALRGEGAHAEAAHEGAKQAAQPVREGLARAAEPVREGLKRAAGPVREAVEQAVQPAREGVEKAAEPEREAEQAAPPAREGVEQAAEPEREAEQAAPPGPEGVEQAAEPKREALETAPQMSPTAPDESRPPPPAEPEAAGQATEAQSPDAQTAARQDIGEGGPRGTRASQEQSEQERQQTAEPEEALQEREAEQESPPPEQAQPEPQEQNTVFMFDGSEESLSAWKHVGMGALERGGSGEGGEGTLRLGVEREQGLAYYRERQFDGFRLRMQYRPDSPNSDSRLAVRFRDPEQPVPDRENPEVRHRYDNQSYVASHTGFEVHLGAGAEPDADPGTFAGVPFGDDAGSQQHEQRAELKAGDWNDLVVEVRGNDYSVWLNGIETAHFVNNDPYRGKPSPEGGFIGFVTKAAASGASAAKAAPEGGAAAPVRRRAGAGPNMRPPPGPPPSALPGPVLGRARAARAAAQHAGEALKGAVTTQPRPGAWLEILRVQAELIEEAGEAARGAEEERKQAKSKRRRQKILSPEEQKAIRKEVAAARAWLKAKKDAGLEAALNKAYAYAIVPAVGRAGLVLGAAHGVGEVFEQGSSVGFVSVTQVTVGVQVGGQTFSEILLFGSKDSLEGFLRGTTHFNANLSAVLLRGASGTADAKGVTIRAYSRGGMLLEASLGGQKFKKVDTAREGEAMPPTAPRKKPREVLRAASRGVSGAAKSALGYLSAHRPH